MKPETQTLCLQYIIEEWRKLQPFQRPDGPSKLPPWAVWIRLYQPISIRQNDLRDPWEYARFIVVTDHRPWSIMSRKPHEAVWG